MRIAPHIDRNSSTDEQSKHWSLSWKPDGYCDRFTTDAIVACAPAASGVYGLFNFDYQIFIGESANIREDLLRLEREADFPSDLLRPTGFTFELCSEESRKQKASELIVRYRPTMQTIASSSERGAAPNGSLSGTEKTGSSSAAPPGNPEVSSREKKAPRSHSYFQFKRAYAGFLFAIVLSAVAYHFRPISDVPSHKNAVENSPANSSSPQVTASNQAEKGSQAEETSTINLAHERKLDKDTPGKADGALRLVNASSADDSRAEKPLTPASAVNLQREKKWSVQIAAAPTKDAAERLRQKLVASGYDTYVVETEVKGQPYYRVRAGPFGARREADAMRDSLMRQDAYRDAYVTDD